MSFSYEIPNLDDVWSTADWIEFYLVCNCQDFSKGEFQDFIESTTGLEADEKELAFIDSVWGEIQNRQVLYGENPPFIVEHNVIRCHLENWQDQPHYCMCLIFSLEGNPHVDGYNSSDSGTLFEKVVRKAVIKFINGKAYIFGHPNEGLEDFANRVDGVDFVNELHPDFNDSGLDVLGVGPFNDGRKNDLTLIVQCAAGKNWPTKVNDVNTDEWFGGASLKFPFNPAKGFAIPVIMEPDDIEKKSNRFGLLIDRPRIYRCVNSVEHDQLETDLITWCDTRINQILA